MIGVYDPFEAPIGFYFGTIDSNLEFSTNFLVKSGINFRIDGTYSIKAHYAETEAISYFNFHNYDETLPTTVDDLEKDIIKNQQSEEKLKESSDELVSEIDNTESQHYQQNKTDKVIDNSDIVSKALTINNSQHSDPNYNDDNSILQSAEQKILIKQQPKNSETQKTKIINENNNTKETISKTKIKKNTNLTVEDIELGKLLNQINLECDSSIFVDTISYYDGMGPALYRLCNFDSSLNFFNKSLIENPDDVEILVNKGSTLGKLGYFSEAIIHYDQAIKLDPDFLPAKNNKANALANLGNFEEAILLYNEILEKNPSYSTAKLNLATTISMIPHTTDIVELSPKHDLEKISFEESSLIHGKSDLTNNESQKSSNFFEDVGVVFSSLGSLFDFLN